MESIKHEGINFEEQRARRSANVDELLKNNKNELKKIKNDLKKKGKNVNLAGLEELLVLLWLMYDDKDDKTLIGELKGLLSKLLDFPKILSRFKLAPSSPSLMEKFKSGKQTHK